MTTVRLVSDIIVRLLVRRGEPVYPPEIVVE